MRQDVLDLLRRSARLLGIVAALASLGAGNASSPSDLEALIKAGKLDEAVTAGRAAVEASPSNPDLRVALAHALAAKGRTVRRVVATTVDAKDLIAGTATLPRIGPDNPPKIEIAYDPGLLEEAIRQIREAIRLAPTRKDLRLTECYLLMDAGDLDRAADAVRETLAALPHTPELADDLSSYGTERARRGDSRGGLVLLEPVRRAFPDVPSLVADRGFVLAQADRRKEAAAELDRAVKLAPTDLRILRRRATAFMLLLDFKRAREGWQAAFKGGRMDEDRLGAAAAAVAFDPKTAAGELSEQATPAASANPALVELAAELLDAASSSGAAKKNIALAKKLADGGKELLAVPLLHRALRADPGLRDAASQLAVIERKFGFPSVAEEVLRGARPGGTPPAKPSRPGGSTPEAGPK
jgi:tetratricopeptide (TPR) repeat protein